MQRRRLKAASLTLNQLPQVARRLGAATAVGFPLVHAAGASFWVYTVLPLQSCSGKMGKKNLETATSRFGFTDVVAIVAEMAAALPADTEAAEVGGALDAALVGWVGETAALVRRCVFLRQR